MGPQPVVNRVGYDSREMKCDCNIGGLKCPLAAINQEMDNSRMRYPPGCHGMVELDDHPGVEERRGVIKGSKEFRCTSLIESLSSGSAAKAGKS